MPTATNNCLLSLLSLVINFSSRFEIEQIYIKLWKKPQIFFQTAAFS